jgi:hypothetical protein
VRYLFMAFMAAMVMALIAPVQSVASSPQDAVERHQDADTVLACDLVAPELATVEAFQPVADVEPLRFQQQHSTVAEVQLCDFKATAGTARDLQLQPLPTNVLCAICYGERQEAVPRSTG